MKASNLIWKERLDGKLPAQMAERDRRLRDRDRIPSSGKGR